VTGKVVRGTVLTGKVVSTASTGGASPPAPQRAVVATISTPATPAKPPSLARASTTPSTSPEEVEVLRVKAMAMEAAQQLLASTQDELKATEQRLAQEREKAAKVEDALSQLQVVTAASEKDISSTSPGDVQSESAHFAQLQISYGLSEAMLSDTKLKYQSALYTLAQLHEKMTANARERAFLEEKNTHLEGQLQRLLMSSMETGPPTAAATGVETTSTQAAPRLSASESYQKSALEKQIADLQAMADKLTSDLRKQTARRAKAESTVQALQKEVTDLKASALQFRRQVNESELELERAVSRKEDEERLRQLERDGNRLRTALRERTEHFVREKTQWESEKDVLDARARVQEAATRQLLRRLLAYQVREVVLRQCDYAASMRRSEAKQPASPSSIRMSSHAATPVQKAPSPSKTAAAAAVESVRSPSTAVRHGTSSSPTQVAATTTSLVNDTAFAASISAGPVGEAADTATLVNRERQLEELKHTFERRVALVDAQRKAEVQQLHALNKELRAALTTSQEELAQKTRLLDSAQQQQQQQRHQLQPLGLAKFASSSASLTPVAPARSSSSVSERRDTAAAWVCRTDGNDSTDGPLGASVDDFCDGMGGVYSTAHTPVVAFPRQVTEIERRYDPEHMSTWEAVQVENEALLDRLTTMQEEKWRLTSYIEDLQRQSNTLKEELKRNASTMNQLLAAGVLTPAAVSRGSTEGSLRALQCLLQETLQEKFALEEKLRNLSTQ
jgi:hypothetical protein